MPATFTTIEGYKASMYRDEPQPNHQWDTPNPIWIGMVSHGKRCHGTGVWDAVTGEELINKRYKKKALQLKLK